MKIQCIASYGLAIISLLFTSCNNNNKDQILLESNHNLVGIATPINLQPGKTTVPVEDYFINPQIIDSVRYTNGSAEMSNDKKTLLLENTSTEPIGKLKVYSGDTIFSLLTKSSDKQEIVFQFKDKEKIFQKVQVKGDFNEWNPQLGELSYSNGLWKTSFWLSPGQFQYKYVLDGAEALDPINLDSISNSFGAFNSVKTVQRHSEVIPSLATLSYTDNTITLETEDLTTVVVLWQNQEITESSSLRDGELAIRIPQVASKLDRSFIRVIGSNDSNISNDILIPLEKGKVVASPNQLNRSDWHASTLYFMMVDRFNNANKANDAPLNIPEVHPRADYYGGDIAGITAKIKSGYFQELGINSIWLSPIVQNSEGPYGLYPKPKTQFSAYHGYWPTSFSKIDYRLGDPDELNELVTLAHENNLNVLIDFVANHVHEEHWVYKEHPDWATELYLPDGSLNTEKWDEYRLTTWFDTHLPTLDLMNPELTDMLTDSAVFWIKEYDLDGFRHDATKHVPEFFWRELTKKLKKEVIIPENKIIYQIGETYGSRPLIASYVSTGQMNAQFDFGVYDDALPCFVKDDVSFDRLQTSINESFKYYGNHHLMGNITGNQDKPRFMAYAGGDLTFEEDSKLAGWTRKIEVTNPLGYDKLKMYLAFNYTIPGIPVIYYGDEIGMTGANDPDNRRQMRFDLENPEEIEVKGTASRLAKLRTSNLEFIFGDFEWLNVSETTLAYARTYFGDISIVVFNKSSVANTVQLELPQRFLNTALVDDTQDEIQNNNGFISLDLEPYSFQIIQSK